MQQIDKVLVFDIWGDYAHFRKIETTTSPLTYFIPTRTALSGIISAILGLERDSYYELFFPENAQLAVRVLKSLKKVRININLIKTDEGFYLWDIRNNPRSPTPFEFVKDPNYR
ncbi:MAG: CRISPR-associated protein Cas5, partial [Thermoplasmata archaeon]